MCGSLSEDAALGLGVGVGVSDRAAEPVLQLTQPRQSFFQRIFNDMRKGF